MAYKVFTNGSPLPASDLNTYLMNQSVMVFANSTARSAALTSPTEGMVTYLEDTNKLEVYTGAAWVDVNDNAAAIPKSTVTTAGDLIVANGNASVTRLGIGANGTVLSSNGTTASWTVPAGGGGATLLSTTTLSGSQVDVTGISGSYQDLYVTVEGFYGSGIQLVAEPRKSGGLGMDRRIFISFWDGSTAGHSGSSDIQLLRETTTSSTQPGTGALYIKDYAQSRHKPLHFYGNAQRANNRSQIGGGVIHDTAALVGLSFYTYSGTMTDGTVRIWGVN